MADRKSTSLLALPSSSKGVLSLGQFDLTPTGLRVRGKPSFDEWQACGGMLRVIEGSIQFAVGDWLNYGEKAYGEKYAQAVDTTQADTWRTFSWVAANVEPSIRIDNLSFNHHREVARFSDMPDIQCDLLAEAAARDLSVSQFKALVRARVHGQKVAAITAGDLSCDEYDVICADPPWQYSNSGFDQSAAAHYPTMDVADICALPDTDSTFPKCADPCVLFLWATSPLLLEGLQVLQAWGFDYKCSLVWVKDRAPGLGWWVKTRHELLLVGTKGTGNSPLEKVDSVIEAAVNEHSRKPAEFYEAIDRMYPAGLRRVECFARTHRKGWDVWGNEVSATGYVDVSR